MTTSRDTYRTMTVVAVLVVAAIAAAVSFVHIEALAVRYGQPRLPAFLLPVSIDGTVAVSSLAMLRSARAGLSSPWLARCGLVLSVGATVACNVGYGLAHGLPGALLSGWPAIAFILSAETAIGMSRRTRPAQQPAGSAGRVPESRTPARTRSAPARRTPAAPVTETAAEAEFMDELAAGTVPSIRQIRTRLHVGSDRARQVQAHLRTTARLSTAPGDERAAGLDRADQALGLQRGDRPADRAPADAVLGL